MELDVAIVGAGVAGLYTAVELLRARPRLRVAVFEKYKEIGGRAATFKGEVDGVAVQWEGGAGRISETHARVRGLMKRYRLTWIPIGGAVQYKDTYTSEFEPNAFEPAIPIILDTLAGLPAEQLATSTIRQLLTRIHGAARAEAFLIRYPYRAEMDIMRADKALDLFRGELGQQGGYGICKEGVTAIADGLRGEVERRGGKVLTHHELVGVRLSEHAASFRVGPPKEGIARPELEVRAAHIVLALPSAAAGRVVGLERLPLWKRLRMTPLLRMYGVFPKEGGKLWYEEYGGRIVTGTPVRYMIPGNAATGTCQISYTDTQDATYWMKKLDAVGEEKVGKEIVEELRRLLKPSIPSPRFVKAHAWDEGVTYWLPGRYDPAEESQRALEPMPGLHFCGESYSLRQGWMEGALEHAEKLVRRLNRKLGVGRK